MTNQQNNKLITTDEAAKILGVQPATLRTARWRDGAYYGITPIKLPNRRLLWPSKAIEALISANA